MEALCQWNCLFLTCLICDGRHVRGMDAIEALYLIVVRVCTIGLLECGMLASSDCLAAVVVAAVASSAGIRPELALALEMKPPSLANSLSGFAIVRSSNKVITPPACSRSPSAVAAARSITPKSSRSQSVDERRRTEQCE